INSNFKVFPLSIPFASNIALHLVVLLSSLFCFCSGNQKGMASIISTESESRQNKSQSCSAYVM
ncbi:hypothetical protein ACTXT7_014586, partial [Hymenolepis weldensis]